MGQTVDNAANIKKKPPFIFYLILGSLPLIFFVALEYSLRLADYGYDFSLFREKDSNSAVEGMLYLNPDLTYKYFGNLKSPVFNPQIGINATKPENSFRVIVLGGSSTQGFPYNPLASFPSHLQRQLNLAYPAKTFEVVNQVDLGDKIGASPVAINDVLYIRTMNHLYAFKE